MAGFFSKLFGGGKKEDLESIVEATLNGILEKGAFDLSYELNLDKKEDVTDVKIEFSGGDEALLKDYKGQLMDAIQLIVKRVTQHHFADVITNVTVDNASSIKVNFNYDSSLPYTYMITDLLGNVVTKDVSISMSETGNILSGFIFP